MINIEHIDTNCKSTREFVNTLLEKQEIANMYIWPGFLKALLETYNLNGHYLICQIEGELTGVASFYNRPGLINKGYLVSVPGGFWAGDRMSEETLIDRVKEIRVREKLKGPYYKDLLKPLNSLDMQSMMHRAVMELPESEEELAGAYSKNIRRDIKQARKKGITVLESSDLESFYDIWTRRMRDLGTPAIPFSFFVNLKLCFKDNMILLVAKKSSQCLGGVILLQFKDTVTDPFLACLTETFKYGVNPLLYHEMLSWAIENGHRYFDLGRSQPGSGNERFKLRFGAKLQPLYSYPRAFSGHSKRIMMCIIRGTWKRMPIELCNKGGPLLRRYVPFG